MYVCVYIYIYIFTYKIHDIISQDSVGKDSWLTILPIMFTECANASHMTLVGVWLSIQSI